MLVWSEVSLLLFLADDQLQISAIETVAGLQVQGFESSALDNWGRVTASLGGLPFDGRLGYNLSKGTGSRWPTKVRAFRQSPISLG